MTDRERLVAVFHDLGIETTPADELGFAEPNPNDVILLSRKGNVDGYVGMFCQFQFDAEGKFIKVGLWE